MIQLASDPAASRTNWRPAAPPAKEGVQARGGRTGHSWPFISRYAEKPVAPQQATKPSSEHGS